MPQPIRREAQPHGSTGSFYSSIQNDRRIWTHKEFEDYFTSGRVEEVTTLLGYSPNQRAYLAEVIGYLSLKPIPTPEGLIFRPSQHGPYSKVESPAPGIGEYTAQPPTNLEWQVKDRMSPQEAQVLGHQGYLLRLYILDESTLIIGSNQCHHEFVQAVHSTEKFPRYGLRRATGAAQVLLKFGLAATYQAEYEEGDWHIEIERPSQGRKSELWRMLPFIGHLPVVGGRVIESAPRTS